MCHVIDMAHPDTSLMQRWHIPLTQRKISNVIVKRYNPLYKFQAERIFDIEPYHRVLFI